jgi:hypothetical protein
MKWKDHVLGFQKMNKPWLSKFDHLSKLKKRKENIDINMYPTIHSKINT